VSEVDNRLKWFGEAPKHWPLRRNKTIFKIVSNKVGDNSADYDLLSLTLKGVILRDVESGKGKFPESFDTYQEVMPNDIVFCLFDIDETPRTVGLSHFSGMITGAYTVVRCLKDIEPRFVTYFYMSIDQRKGLRPFYTGLRKVVRSETFLNAPIPCPELQTQRAIADFLDRETARIDDLIAKKQRLVALVAEKERSIINNAILGYIFSGNKKNVSVPWLKKIPTHWDLRPIKKLLSMPITDGPHETPIFIDEGVPFISAEAIQNNNIDFSKKRGFISEAQNEIYSRKYSPRTGDIYIVKSGATTGKSAMVGDFTEFNIWSPLAVLRSKKNVDNTFLLNLVKSSAFQDAISINWSWGTQQNIGMGALGRIHVPIPPLEEQIFISEFINTSCQKLLPLKDNILESIQKLKEYRAALITAAVTGQLAIPTPPQPVLSPV